MKAFSLYDRTSTFGGIYVFFIINRMQMLYFNLIMPMYLVDPYMIWGIIGVGLFSQVNLWMLSKFLVSDFSTKGYQGFVELFGERLVRFFALLGLFLVLIKTLVITIGYVEIVHQFIFPSMNANWLMLFLFLISCNLASTGMEKTIRFVVIVFLFTIWILLVFPSFFFSPMASLHDLYPLWTTDLSAHSWKGLLFIWGSMSGPEYLICLAPWFHSKQKMLKYLTWANAFTVIENLILFISCLLFFGSTYLSKINFPVVNLIRYLRSPVLERIDILLLSFHMFHYVFSAALFLLFFYGAIRILTGKRNEQTTRIGFLTSCLSILVFLILVKKWLWGPGAEANILPDLQIWLGACTYFLVPAFLLFAIKRKGRA